MCLKNIFMNRNKETCHLIYIFFKNNNNNKTFGVGSSVNGTYLTNLNNLISKDELDLFSNAV